MKKIFNFFGIKILLILTTIFCLYIGLSSLFFPFSCLFSGTSWDYNLYDFETYYCTILVGVMSLGVVTLLIITILFYLLKKIHLTRTKTKDIFTLLLLIIISFYVVSYGRDTYYDIERQTSYSLEVIQCSDEHTNKNIVCHGVNSQKAILLKMLGFLGYSFLGIKNEHLLFDVSSMVILLIIFILHIKLLQKIAKKAE